MNKFYFFVLLLFVVSCSKDCEDKMKDLKSKYDKAISNANGNLDAITELRRQYQEQLNKLDCD